VSRAHGTQATNSTSIDNIPRGFKASAVGSDAENSYLVF
jgi:hypothetical protein